MWNRVFAFPLAAILTLGTATQLAAQKLPLISANDNRITAGSLKDGVLTLRLEMRKGIWHPESEDGEAIPVYAFGEAGRPLQIPGPAIRVPQGTTIDITLHNDLAVPATLHGLHKRPGTDADVVTVAAGATRHVRFVAGAPGTYLYYGRTPDGLRGNQRLHDALLGGALVVDPPGPTPDDRIFVLERWDGATRTAINGKSWPFTERLDYRVGERVHWKIVNASDLSHPMHLHGFHFELDAVGDGEKYTIFEDGTRPLEFTHNVEIAETFAMTWVPKEPGRWLYHCHRFPHMRLPIPLAAADVVKLDNHEHVHAHDSDYLGMGGMIMGLTVTGPSHIDTSTNWTRGRHLELAVGNRSDDPRFFQIALRNLAPAAAHEKPQMSTGLTGPVIVLTQNQPTEIAVTNTLKTATAIHWHGIELESYFDGVPGWNGVGDKRAPAVEPGHTFSARMIPPRAGTFMYHTHWHDAAQLTGGVHGPLIVLPPGQTHDPATDKAFLFSQSPNEPFGVATILMNGVPQPNTLRLTVGTTYRLRFMNITPSVNNLRVALRQAGRPVEWRQIAKDAAELPPGTIRVADQQIAVGETFDFEYRATASGELTLEAWNPNDNRRAVQTLIFTP
jgi:FtsP/CotA-like multicopper oxidase with cupredoxin domain